MDKRYLKAIVRFIKKTSGLSKLKLLQSVCFNTGLDVDSRYVYFNLIDRSLPLPLSSIYGILIRKHFIYILTLDKHLHAVSLWGHEHNVFSIGRKSVMFELDCILYKFHLLFG